MGIFDGVEESDGSDLGGWLTGMDDELDLGSWFSGGELGDRFMGDAEEMDPSMCDPRNPLQRYLDQAAFSAKLEGGGFAGQGHEPQHPGGIVSSEAPALGGVAKASGNPFLGLF